MAGVVFLFQSHCVASCIGEDQLLNQRQCQTYLSNSPACSRCYNRQSVTQPALNTGSDIVGAHAHAHVRAHTTAFWLTSRARVHLSPLLPQHPSHCTGPTAPARRTCHAFPRAPAVPTGPTGPTSPTGPRAPLEEVWSGTRVPEKVTRMPPGVPERFLTLRVSPPAHPETMPRRIEVIFELRAHTE